MSDLILLGQWKSAARFTEFSKISRTVRFRWIRNMSLNAKTLYYYLFGPLSLFIHHETPLVSLYELR